MKPYEEFGFKDERNILMEEMTGRPHGKEAYYRYAKQFQFDDSIPENVREMWSMAMDLFTHIHFNYEFSVASNLYVLMTVETALKEVMKSEIARMDKETLGKVIKKFIEKYEEPYGLNENDKRWLRGLPVLRNWGAHMSRKMYATPFGQNLIRPSYNFICGLFYNPLMILMPHSPFVLEMDYLCDAINEHPFVVHKRRQRQFEEDGLLGMGY